MEGVCVLTVVGTPAGPVIIVRVTTVAPGMVVWELGRVVVIIGTVETTLLGGDETTTTLVTPWGIVTVLPGMVVVSPEVPPVSVTVTRLEVGEEVIVYTLGITVVTGGEEAVVIVMTLIGALVVAVDVGFEEVLGPSMIVTTLPFGNIVVVPKPQIDQAIGEVVVEFTAVVVLHGMLIAVVGRVVLLGWTVVMLVMFCGG